MKTPRKKRLRPRIGDSVLVLRVPSALSKMEPDSCTAFQLSVGHRFKVQGRNNAGWLELEVGRIVDPGIGGFMNTIWIEPACVRVVRRKVDSK